jgi:dTDP-4-dehydrorhamnose 3,5-epimerase
MPFEFEALGLAGAILIAPKVFPDERGYFLETYKYSAFAAAGIEERFVQENHSRSTKGVVRGLHFQVEPHAQGKLVQALEGEVFDVLVDIRAGSPTFGRWRSVVLSADNQRMLYIPPWCAHGFCVLSDQALVAYKVTHEYAPEAERGLIWNDPDIGIEWPVREAVLSTKDEAWPPLDELRRERSMGAAVAVVDGKTNA